jgi:hypothetical protein
MMTRVLVMTLLTACLLQGPASAEGTPERVLQWSSFGLARDQRARFTLAAPGHAVRASVKLFDANGALVAASDEAIIPAGGFHAFDFDAADMQTPEEPGTGRRQLRASGHVKRVGPGPSVDPLAATLEILDGGTGTTGITDGTSNTLMVGERPPSLVGEGRDLLVGGAGRDVLIGAVPGQLLRVTLAHVGREPAGGRKHPDLAVGVWILDASGRVAAKSAEVTLPRDHFHVFDFDPETLPIPGELTTGRVQLHTIVLVNGGGNVPSAPDPGRPGTVLSSVELVDKGTGATAARARSVNNLKQISLGSF